MSSTQTPLEPGQPTPEPELSELPLAAEPEVPGAPLSFVPHQTQGQKPISALRMRTGRFGELEEHELIRLLDTIEDERARGRFRESIYISFFVWLAIAWFLFYGPRVLWHAPQLVNPADVLRSRELTQLNMPVLTPHLPTSKATPKPAPRPTIDNHTLEHLRAMHPTPAPAPLPNAPAPTNPAPAMTQPAAPQPVPRTNAPVLAEAPTPQPATKPNFNTGAGTAGDAIQNAVRGAARNRGGNGDFASSPSGSPLNTGVDILSDTQGVNFDPYLRRILSDIKRNWLPLIPEEARPPLNKQGETFVRFTILPDGNIGAMHLDGSTHDDAINHSCWSAITSEGQFPPLPSQFHGPNLELRIHFLVNKGIE